MADHEARLPVTIDANELRRAVREAVDAALDPLRTTIDEMAARSDEAAAALRRLSGQLTQLGAHAGIDLDRAERAERKAQEREEEKRRAAAAPAPVAPGAAREPETGDELTRAAGLATAAPAGEAPNRFRFDKPHRWESDVRIGKRAHVCADCERDIRDGEGRGCPGPKIRREDNPNRKRNREQGRGVADKARRTAWAKGAAARKAGEPASAVPYESNRAGFRHAWLLGHAGTPMPTVAT